MWQTVDHWAFRIFLTNTHYCWFVGDNGSMAAQGCFALLISPANSGFSCFFFFLLHLALKNAVLIKFSFWHRLPRETLMRRRRRRRRKKQAQVSMTDPAEWEGSSAGRAKGENHLYPFFAHFHFERTPVGLTLGSAFHRKPGGQTQPWPSLWIRRSPELLKDVWIHGRQETGGTQYWLCWHRSGRGNKSIGQTVCTWSLAQRVAR